MHQLFPLYLLWVGNTCEYGSVQTSNQRREDKLIEFEALPIIIVLIHYYNSLVGQTEEHFHVHAIRVRRCKI